MQTAWGVKCPWLGSWQDDETAFGYPTGQNACFANRRGKGVDKTRQQQFCLNANYRACPIFVKTGDPDKNE